MTSAAVATPLRILAVTARYLPLVGGTEIHTYETARRIARSGNDVTVLTTNPGTNLAEEEWSDGVHIVRVPCWPAQGDYYLAPRVARVISRGGWDLVHCQGVHTLVSPLAMLAAKRANAPYVVTFHSGGHSSRLRTGLRGVQHAVLRPLLARAERLIGVSRFEAEFFRARLRLPAERFVVIPNGAHLPDAPPVKGTRKAGPLIVSVGRLERYKGHQRVIAALPYVLGSRPDARVRIVGRGPFEASLRQAACELGVADRVEIGALPASDRAAMASILAEASVVTFLSEYESQGIAAMEAIQLKRPVLVADASALHELVENGLASRVAVHSTPQQVAAAILEQLDRPLIPPDVALPTWDNCAEQLLGLYSSVLRGPECAF
ncbi:MAG TPA: glycosyltransferase family 4 protein [Nitrolancea sp.]|jgi:glycosyltransferase involved in cell wall biosynthesis|nr:glycosyltransferase family 4 protein [Nitrolancea sp.]